MPNKLPQDIQSFVERLYHPDFDPEELKLTGALSLSEDDIKIVEERVAEVEKKLFSSDRNDIPTPLTEEEAAAIEQKVDEMRDAIAATRRRIASIRAKIDEQAAPDGQPEISFAIDLKKKGRLRRAIKKVFGVKPESLTYSMYKTALEAKKQLEEREAENYTSGNWED